MWSRARSQKVTVVTAVMSVQDQHPPAPLPILHVKMTSNRRTCLSLSICFASFRPPCLLANLLVQMTQVRREKESNPRHWQGRALAPGHHPQPLLICTGDGVQQWPVMVYPAQSKIFHDLFPFYKNMSAPNLAKQSWIGPLGKRKRS